MIASYLPLAELQSILPGDLIKEISTLLSRMDPRPGYDVLSDRELLARLYDAYHGVDLLSRPSHRRHLLNHVPADKLRRLAARLSLSTEGTFSQILNRVAVLPWGANDGTKTFLEFFGYPPDYLPEAAPNTPTLETVEPISPPLRTLHDYQASVFFRALDLLRLPCARFMVQMPTGAGKTRTAMELVAAFLNHYPETAILWLAHTEELCEQAVGTFAAVWRHVGRIPIDLYRCWGSHAPRLPAKAPALIVAGLAKLHSIRISGGGLSPSADLVVVDEAHMVLAPTYSAAVAWAKKPSARIIGLSATPGRSSARIAQSEELAEYFNDQIIGVETDGEGVIEFLQGKGILARALREPVYTNVTFHLEPDEWRRLEEELDFPSAFLKRVAENHQRNRIIAERLWQLAAEGARVLLFAGSVEQSRLLCALLIYKGIPAAHVDGSTNPETRRAVIAKFRRGEIQFLSNYQVFSAGFDVPAVDVVFIARPTKSIVLYSQMVGRGMRGPAVGGTPTFRLIDVVDNIIDYSGDLDEVYDYFSEYWSD
jgi:DNA repair protein RadD